MRMEGYTGSLGKIMVLTPLDAYTSRSVSFSVNEIMLGLNPSITSVASNKLTARVVTTKSVAPMNCSGLKVKAINSNDAKVTAIKTRDPTRAAFLEDGLDGKGAAFPRSVVINLLSSSKP